MIIQNLSGSSIALFLSPQNDSRRFRIKFGKSSDRSAIEHCRQFVSEISSQISVREISTEACVESDSQVQMEDSQLISPESQHALLSRDAAAGAGARGLTLPDLANKVGYV